MRRSLRLLTHVASAALGLWPDAARAEEALTRKLATETPEGFEALLDERARTVSVFVDGRDIGAFAIETRPGAVLFGRTRLAVALAQGASLDSYANERIVAVDAARFLLKGVFAKTGVNKQPRLVALFRDAPQGWIEPNSEG